MLKTKIQKEGRKWIKKKKAKNEMIEKLENTILSELENLKESDEGKVEKLEKGDVLFNMYKILSNYDELKPVLIKFFAEKHRKEKFEGYIEESENERY